MDIKFFNVEHGFCATVDLDDSHTILIDCGHNASKGFSPGMYLVKSHHTKVDCLVLPSYSEHHLDGFGELISQFVDNFFTPKIVVANPSIPSVRQVDEALHDLGINNVLKLFDHGTKEQPVFQHSLKFDDLRLTFFWNSTKETNNLDDLSLVTFLCYSDINIIFPGDLTEPGWQRLLDHPEFVEYLTKVNLFVASNHGQRVGYCADVFKHCHPQLVIVSNDVDHPMTEEMTKLYASHAKGIPVDQANRQLLMTHRDGRVNISRYLDRRLEISTEPFYRN